ncbi:aldo/keto reductase [Streptomyces cellostaticus]|uniref:aldo/keto reductase n=1 Tax=Streptomyces cellostaticus TaxID=67285 RepID=UPI002026A134|nr:aldo/keto reductase [Streptomyces cellostaticus]
MKQRKLGSTGLLVSELALGCMTFGNEVEESEAHAIIDAFVEAGGTLFDTADCYHGGKSERILGKALGSRRDDFVIATKSGLRVGDGPNDVGASAKHLIRSAERSLRHLGTDYIDLYQIHCWDPETPVEETLAALDTLWRQGKVRYFGVSNQAGWQISKTYFTALLRNTPQIVSVQTQYSLVEREVEREVIPACLNLGLGVLPWGPLGGGFLSGKYHAAEQPPAGSRLARSVAWMEEHWERRATPRGWAVLDAVREVAAATGATSAQVALAWLARQPAVTSPIIGASCLAHAKDNLGAAALDLSDEHLALLDRAGAVEPQYPQRFVDVAMHSRTDFVPDRDAWIGLR